ncbi:armadillo repeat-containing protein 7-like isoform X1 [Octopus bimaculoides]|uniref:armadillo repeat-containing protein 7-like isoform X1 n=1 Tax=Octopus bimaculoides TaxID=37653 RepID=UPI0022E72C1E|nr:armadillo repeat-containing protein 7-like isoform X1 [Octopus bimaculoides]
MFSSEEYLRKKTGEYGIGRLSYLQSLVTEFEETTSDDAKKEILANLANFGYDPLNYGFFRQLNILDLFLDSLEDNDEKMVEFAIAGLCNCCLDEKNKEFIIKNDGVNIVKKHCLSGANEETLISALTCLMFLITPASKKAILTEEFTKRILDWSGNSNARIKNLATIFIEDYFNKEDNKVKYGDQASVADH